MRCKLDRNIFTQKYIGQQYCCLTPECTQLENERKRAKIAEQNEKAKLKPFKPLKRTAISPSAKPIAKRSKKTQEARKEDRKGYSEFFIKMIGKIKRERINCENCGAPIRNPNAGNVCHVLSKRKTHHPEVATEERNIVFLCDAFTGSACHSQFDKDLTTRLSMPVFETSAKRVEPLLYKLINQTKERAQIEDYLQSQT